MNNLFIYCNCSILKLIFMVCLLIIKSFNGKRNETSLGFNIISLTDITFYSFNLSTLLLVSE